MSGLFDEDELGLPAAPAPVVRHPKPPKAPKPPPPPPAPRRVCKWCSASACGCCAQCGTTTPNHGPGCTNAPVPVSVPVTDLQRLTLKDRAWQCASLIRPKIAPGPMQEGEALLEWINNLIYGEMEAALKAALRENTHGENE